MIIDVPKNVTYNNKQLLTSFLFMDIITFVPTICNVLLVLLSIITEMPYINFIVYSFGHGEFGNLTYIFKELRYILYNLGVNLFVHLYLRHCNNNWILGTSALVLSPFFICNIYFRFEELYNFPKWSLGATIMSHREMYPIIWRISCIILMIVVAYVVFRLYNIVFYSGTEISPFVIWIVLTNFLSSTISIVVESQECLALFEASIWIPIKILHIIFSRLIEIIRNNVWFRASTQRAMEMISY